MFFFLGMWWWEVYSFNIRITPIKPPEGKYSAQFWLGRPGVFQILFTRVT